MSRIVKGLGLVGLLGGSLMAISRKQVIYRHLGTGFGIAGALVAMAAALRDIGLSRYDNDMLGVLEKPCELRSRLENEEISNRIKEGHVGDATSNYLFFGGLITLAAGVGSIIHYERSIEERR